MQTDLELSRKTSEAKARRIRNFETVNIEKIFQALQEQLAANLRGGGITDHPGAKGEASEVNWISMLEAHLPRRYSVSKAFVLDCDGHHSDEIDVVIYDRQYTPALYNYSHQIFIPAESVYAVLEVKQAFNKTNIDYAGKKAKSVRMLSRTATNIVHASGVASPRPLTPILSGILAYGSDWSPPFGNSFEQVLKERPDDERLDIGCALSVGTFEVECREGSEPVISTVGSSLSLMHFFLSLLKRLQGLGTISAIDYSRYLGALDRHSAGG